MTRLLPLGLLCAAGLACAQTSPTYEYRQVLSGVRAGAKTLPKAVLGVSSASLAFTASVPGGSQTRQVLLSNDGAAPLNFSGAPALAGSGAFSASSSCGATLQMAETCTVSVTFSPESVGASAATLTMSGDFTQGSVAVSLSGTATELAPASSFYDWPAWYARTDGYVNDWYAYDNNGDGVPDGTRVGSVTPNSAYVLDLSGGARTVLAVEPLTPGLTFDTSAKDYPNCFQAGVSPAPSWNGQNVACYAYPRYTVQKAGPNKVLFRVRHTLGEDLLGIVFYGYEGPSFTFGMPSSVALGPLTGSSGQYTFQVSNAGPGVGKLSFQGGYGAIADASTCTGTTTSSMEAVLQPGASCSLKLSWPMYTTSGTVTIRALDVLGNLLGQNQTVTWTK